MNRSRRILVTAGPTVEDIDPVRFISNRASGRLGVEIARAALRRKHKVILVHGPVPPEILRIAGHARCGVFERRPIRSAAEMCRAVRAASRVVDAVIMNAAVADYTPASVSKTKMKKDRAHLLLRLKPTVDILAELGRVKQERGRPRTLIGFALETGHGRTRAARARSRLREARRKMSEKNLDAIVLDTPAEIGAETGAFQVLIRDREDPVSFRGSKRAFGTRVIELLESLSR